MRKIFFSCAIISLILILSAIVVRFQVHIRPASPLLWSEVTESMRPAYGDSVLINGDIGVLSITFHQVCINQTLINTLSRMKDPQMPMHFFFAENCKFSPNLNFEPLEKLYFVRSLCFLDDSILYDEQFEEFCRHFYGTRVFIGAGKTLTKRIVTSLCSMRYLYEIELDEVKITREAFKELFSEDNSHLRIITFRLTIIEDETI